MKRLYFLFLVSFLFYSCRQNKNHIEISQTMRSDTATFFPMTEYIKSQIAEVNKTPYYIYKTTVINTKKDSIPINTAVFNQISAEFLTPDINEKELKKLYKENIFHDETTKSFAISYTTSDKQLEIQNVDVLLQEDGETVKRIFIRKFFNYTDSSAIEQLSWKPGESFQINRLVQKPNNKENSYVTNVVWNEKS